MVPVRYVLVPFQVDSDTQLLRHSPWVADMRALFALLESLLPVARALERVLLCKPHPASPFDYSDLRARAQPHLRFVDDHDCAALVSGADGVLTINSTVGLEAVLAGKPVLALGEAFYTMPGLAWRAVDADAIGHWLRMLDQDRSGVCPDPDVVRGLHRYLVTSYGVPGDWRRADAAHRAAVVRRLRELVGV